MPEQERPGGVRIAVIDSGIHPGHPHIHASRLAEGVAVARDGTITRGGDVTLDRLGHGTAVAAAIQQWAPQATIVPVRVFGSALKASPRAVIAAIDWSIEHGADLINLSLGTTTWMHRAAFARAVESAHDAGTVLVAARDAGGLPSLPGALPETIGVRLDWDCPRAGWRIAAGGGEQSGSGAEFLASGYPRPIPGVAQQRNLYGISFAVANMTGFAAAMLASHLGLPGGRERLSALCALLSASSSAQASSGAVEMEAPSS